MATPFSQVRSDGDSDYGSDFTVEEEAILNELVARASRATADRQLALSVTDIEDYETLPVAHVPHNLKSQRRIRREENDTKWSPRAWEDRVVSVHFDGHDPAEQSGAPLSTIRASIST